MTFPVGTPPDGAFQIGSKFGSDLNKDTAVAVMTGGIKRSFQDVRGTFKDNVEQPLGDKPSLTQVPVGSPMWQSLGKTEDTTFPRSQLTFGAASSTSSGGGSSGGSHSHSLRTVPDYQPAGHGGCTLEMGYIQAQRDRTYKEVGFITGDSITAFGINGFYIGVYSVDTKTGNVTLLNPISAAVDMRGSFGATNTEYRFNLGTSITAKQGDVFAVGTLQLTSLGQTCSSFLCITMNKITPAAGQAFPRAQYCYSGAWSAMPSSIEEKNLKYNESSKVPFYVLR
ncbi:hypothetical protein ACQPW1_09960 [Nocardia sp. CA-128927]|uniref:hypothetical protein n=1 Tax=Nocardia sp. CA-128927 TaxID=3239975 RepID=UPI003D99AE1E